MIGVGECVVDIQQFDVVLIPIKWKHWISATFWMELNHLWHINASKELKLEKAAFKPEINAISSDEWTTTTTTEMNKSAATFALLVCRHFCRQRRHLHQFVWQQRSRFDFPILFKILTKSHVKKELPGGGVCGVPRKLVWPWFVLTLTGFGLKCSKSCTASKFHSNRRATAWMNEIKCLSHAVNRLHSWTFQFMLKFPSYCHFSHCVFPFLDQYESKKFVCKQRLCRVVSPSFGQLSFWTLSHCSACDRVNVILCSAVTLHMQRRKMCLFAR